MAVAFQCPAEFLVYDDLRCAHGDVTIQDIGLVRCLRDILQALFIRDVELCRFLLFRLLWLRLGDPCLLIGHCRPQCSAVCRFALEDIASVLLRYIGALIDAVWLCFHCQALLLLLMCHTDVIGICQPAIQQQSAFRFLHIQIIQSLYDLFLFLQYRPLDIDASDHIRPVLDDIELRRCIHIQYPALELGTILHQYRFHDLRITRLCAQRTCLLPFLQLQCHDRRILREQLLYIQLWKDAHC